MSVTEASKSKEENSDIYKCIYLLNWEVDIKGLTFLVF